jgi:HSP20 family protein
MLPMLARETARVPMFGLRNEIDRLFDEFLPNGNGGFGWLDRRLTGPTAFVPAIDMKETDTNLVIEVEVPGLKSNEVDIQIEEGVLILRGERKQEKEEKARQWHRSERYWGKFERRIALPEYADAEKVDAVCKDGVLLVTVPKKAGVKPKAISIRVK